MKEEDYYLVKGLEKELSDIQKLQKQNLESLGEIRVALIAIACMILGFGFYFAGAW
jgi:hypothetical protein